MAISIFEVGDGSYLREHSTGQEVLIGPLMQKTLLSRRISKAPPLISREYDPKFALEMDHLSRISQAQQTAKVALEQYFNQ